MLQSMEEKGGCAESGKQGDYCLIWDSPQYVLPVLVREEGSWHAAIPSGLVAVPTLSLYACSHTLDLPTKITSVILVTRKA